MAEKFVRATMVLLVQDGVVYLGRRKVSPFCGDLSGHGGKLEEGETPTVCAVREVEEEVGILVRPADLEWIGFLNTYRVHGFDEPVRFRVHLYVARSWMGEFVDSDEMSLPEPVELDKLSAYELRPEIREILEHLAHGPFDRGVLVEAEDVPGGTSKVHRTLI